MMTAPTTPPGQPAAAPAESAAPAGQRQQVDEATSQLLGTLAGLTDADRARPSLCPGWTAGHILTHLARNADALRGAAEGARRGEQVAMYPSAAARDHDIEAGADRPIAELRADVTTSAQALREVWASLAAGDWQQVMPHHRFGAVPLHATPAMRLREVHIHHVDLAGSYQPPDWPPAFVTHVIDLTRPGLPGRLAGDVRLDLRITDTGEELTAGTGASQVTVSGPSWAVAAWLIGRLSPAADALTVTGGPLPALTTWG